MVSVKQLLTGSWVLGFVSKDSWSSSSSVRDDRVEKVVFSSEGDESLDRSKEVEGVFALLARVLPRCARTAFLTPCFCSIKILICSSVYWSSLIARATAGLR